MKLQVVKGIFLGLATTSLLSTLFCTGDESPSPADLRDASDSTMVFTAVLRPHERNSPSARAGKGLYQRYCAVCHGSEGDGEGFNSYNLQSSFELTPTAFTDSTYWSLAEPGRMESSIKGKPSNVRGNTCLFSWAGTLTSQQISDVVVYLHTFRKHQ